MRRDLEYIVSKYKVSFPVFCLDAIIYDNSPDVTLRTAAVPRAEKLETFLKRSPAILTFLLNR